MRRVKTLEGTFLLTGNGLSTVRLEKLSSSTVQLVEYKDPQHLVYNPD